MGNSLRPRDSARIDPTICTAKISAVLALQHLADEEELPFSVRST